MYNDWMIMDGDLVNETSNTGAGLFRWSCEITHVGELGESMKSFVTTTGLRAIVTPDLTRRRHTKDFNVSASNEVTSGCHRKKTVKIKLSLCLTN
jgi:hypothetical protein